MGHTVITVFLIAALLPLRDLTTAAVGVSNYPAPALAGIALISLAAFHRARWQINLPWFTLAAGALTASLLLSSALLQPDFDFRRAGTFGITLLLAYMLASGRLHLDSVRRGLMLGLAVGLAQGAIVLAEGQSGYVGRLTGILGDPNAIGFSLVTLGFVIAHAMNSRRNLTLLWLVLAGGIWLTQSRTSMFAFAVATLWAIFGRRLGRITGLVALIGVVWLFQWASEFAERQGWFQERLGSDNLRDRLAAAEQTLTDSSGWLGHGLGTAYAEFDGIFLFFHNSYRALQTEGGLIALILVCLMGLSLFWAFYKLPAERRPVRAEAAIIAACICSFNIGYSLTSIQMATAVGMYLAYHCLAREELTAETAAGELVKPKV